MAEGGPPMHRSKSRIFADILRALNEGQKVKITHLLHAANVPYDRLIAYLARMEKAGLVERTDVGDRSSYVITGKGEKYLMELKKLEEFSSIFGVEI